MALLLLLMAGAALAGEKTVHLVKSGQVEPGQQAPWLAGWTLQGEVFNTKKVFADPDFDRLALVFFGTWCKHCVKGLQMLKGAEAALAEAGIKVVIVDLQDEFETITAFRDKQAVPFTIVHDRWENCGPNYLYDEQGRYSLPRTVICDRDGMVVAIFGAEGDDYITCLLGSD